MAYRESAAPEEMTDEKPSLEMRPFHKESDAECPKCRRMALHRWAPLCLGRKGICGKSPCPVGVEHFHRKCEVCRWSCIEEPGDAVTSPGRKA